MLTALCHYVWSSLRNGLSDEKVLNGHGFLTWLQLKVRDRVQSGPMRMPGLGGYRAYS